ncbi:hypothetical protein D9619_002439 [Psilocybe cf. subviscida]|uniref:F-box domain-containing protein n=1 Tax=Psilocybe cf. subviscida TaxID=2480587 RepID=A0A8H5EU68_9AGAR|nr:hypothetical protein D9619_002439 [Psilocybe cf. subviscida]
MSCIHGESCLACKALAEVDKGVLEARRALIKAKERRRVVAETLNQKHDRFIQGMPPEIATMVFAFDLEQNLANDPSRPLKLSAVCKRWRQLAFSTQQLWSTMLCQRQKWPWRFPVELVEPWIKRAGGRLMNITVSWDARKHIGGPLGPSLARQGMKSVEPLFRVIEAQKNAVKTLNLMIPSIVLDCIKEGNFEDFENASKIAVHLLSCSFFEISNVTRLKPTELAIDGHITPHDCLRVLRLCASRLTSCQLQGIHTPRTPVAADDLHDLQLPNLTDLHLHFRRTSAGVAPQFFLPLGAPALRSLSIHLSQTSDVAMTQLFFPEITTFINTVADTLESLSLMLERAITEEEIVTLLTGLPALTTFHLQYHEHHGFTALQSPASSGALLKTLAQRGEVEHILLPNLREFRLRGATITSWTAVADLFAMHSKKNSLRPLESIDLTPAMRLGLRTGQYVLPKRILQRLFVIPKNGLKFAISNSSILHDSVLYHKLSPNSNVLAYYNLTLRAQPLFNFDNFDPYDLPDFSLLH